MPTTMVPSMAQLLRRRFVPTVLGFDPMVQVIHEQDLAAAFGSALGPGLRGAFNVAGAGAVPLSVLIREAGATRLPIPDGIYPRVLGRFGMPSAAAGVVEFIKHPCLVDDGRFRQVTGWKPLKSLPETLQSMR